MAIVLMFLSLFPPFSSYGYNKLVIYLLVAQSLVISAYNVHSYDEKFMIK